MTSRSSPVGAAGGLVGTTAIVTGASRGFGRAIAAALTAAGAHVVGVARTSAHLDEVHDQLGDTFTAVTADAADPATARGLIDAHKPRHVRATVGDDSVEYDGVDRFRLRGDLADEVYVVFDTAPMRELLGRTSQPASGSQQGAD
jgi:NAD(P)-dependent dehydrogenase (short-subunit alcohol dehydrogenase family)